MSELDNIHIARPYANAAFAMALEQGELSQWERFLAALALISQDAAAHRVIADPRITRTQKYEWLADLCDAMRLLNEQRKTFIHLLAENQRLSTLSVLAEMFSEKKREHEKSILIRVRSAQPLTDAQQQELTAALKQRYQRDVQLSLDVDTSMIGGVVVNAGDEIIDGSLRGQLHRLLTSLAHPYQ